jgi:hypothetical protein
VPAPALPCLIPRRTSTLPCRALLTNQLAARPAPILPLAQVLAACIFEDDAMFDAISQCHAEGIEVRW